MKDARKKRKFHDAIFRGKPFIECALSVRKMKSLGDFIPEIVKGCGLVQADVDNCPIKSNPTTTESFLKSVPDMDDPVFGPVPDQVSNAIHGKLCDTMLADMAKGNERMAAAAVKAASSEQLLDLWNRGVMYPVSILTRQVSFLWYSFKAHDPSIDILTKDAFDLVKDTKLDENVTADMVEAAFPRDVFLNIRGGSVHGFSEIAAMRRGGQVAIACGQEVDRRNGDLEGIGAAACPFVVLGSVDLAGNAGRINRGSLSDSVIEIRDRNAMDLDQRLKERGLEDDEISKVHDIFFDGFHKSKSGEGKAAGIVADLAMFVLKLRLMLLSEKSPVEEIHSSAGGRTYHDGVELPPGRSGLSFSVVSLTKEFRDAVSRPSSDSGRKLDKFGKNMVEKHIAGFIRRQRYGKGNALSKYIYIAPFTNRFWVNSGVHVTKIVK